MGEQSRDNGAAPHLACPFCSGYAIGRMYVASTNVDSCECLACGARWDEDAVTGDYRGRSTRASGFIHLDE